MKTERSLRFFTAFSLASALTLVSASALERANVYLVGKEIAHGGSLAVASGKEKIAKSKRYTYAIEGSCKGIGPLAALVPAGTRFSAFLDTVSPGSSRFLEGTLENPTGNLPAVLVNRRISGSKKVKGPGKVSVSFNLKVEVSAVGEISVKLSNVNISSPSGPLDGGVRFLKGAKAVVSTAPIIQMKTLSKNVAESAGTVAIEVMRSGFQQKEVTVAYATSDDGAVAGVDYTAAAGTLVFPVDVTKQTIVIPVTDTLASDGFRKFKVTLSAPGGGAVLGGNLTTTVGIQND
jgi:hypothetical protein